MQNIFLLSRYHNFIYSQFAFSSETSARFDQAKDAMLSALPASSQSIKQKFSQLKLHKIPPLINEDGSLSRDANPYIFEVEDVITDPRVEARIKAVQPACVKVRNILDTSRGSGVNLSADGMIITNHHVIDDIPNSQLRVEFPDGRVFSGKVTHVSKKDDLAIVSIDSREQLPYAYISPVAPRIGQKIIVIGNPGPDPRPFDVQTGRIKRRLTPEEWEARKVKIGGLVYDIPRTRPGHSGSPIFDEQGRVVAIVNAMNGADESEEYAVTHERMIAFLKRCGALVEKGN
jgi:S1-C subfamily serine protease